MFETAEIGHSLSKAKYDAIVPDLRESLLDAQFDLLEKRDKSVLIVVGGVDGAGKGDTINLLQTWLDPRHVEVHALGPRTDEERERPEYYRFWRRLPARGTIGIFFGSWHTVPILMRAYKETNRSDMDTAMERIRHFERMLTHEGVVLLKLWFHLSKEQQRERLESLQKNKHTRWRVTESDWKHFEIYDRFRKVSTRAIRETSTSYAPWIVVPGAEPKYRQVMVGRSVLEALTTTPPSASAAEGQVINKVEPPDGKTLLDTVELEAELGKKAYKKELEKLQGKLNLLFRSPEFADRSLVVLFEGWDAAGKGGAIRRVTSALDVRTYRVISIAAPSDDEKARPYLWRFWRHVPRHGKATIFDRSWYGRVLVERVEGYTAVGDWMRGYEEINDFEEQLVDNGTIVVKLWLHISKEEQLERFRARKSTGFKRHKLTPDDWRNRDRWEEYERAVSDMVERTSTELAPWTLIPANDKRHARIAVLETLTGRIADAL